MIEQYIQYDFQIQAGKYCHINLAQGCKPLKLLAYLFFSAPAFGNIAGDNNGMRHSPFIVAVRIIGHIHNPYPNSGKFKFRVIIHLIPGKTFIQMASYNAIKDFLAPDTRHRPVNDFFLLFIMGFAICIIYRDIIIICVYQAQKILGSVHDKFVSLPHLVYCLVPCFNLF